TPPSTSPRGPSRPNSGAASKECPRRSLRAAAGRHTRARRGAPDWLPHHRRTSVQNTAPREAERGFTLIELMIVVAIIAILAGILIPNFVNARSQAQTAACESNLRSIATALELYYADNQ